MNFIDSHAHIFTKEFENDLDEVVSKAMAAGVTKICMPNIDHESIDDMLFVAQKYPENCFPMMGLHPCSVTKDFEKQLYEVENWLSKYKFIAVGEMGTDLYWDKSLFEYQQEAFEIQCQLALKHDIPVVIHCRESIDETIQLVEKYYEKGLRGVFHCFTGNEKQLLTIEEMGFFIGIGGVSTFKNGGLEGVVKAVSSDKLVLETDSPYLSPVPYRGKRNEPVRILNIAHRVAEIRGAEVQEIAEITTRNTQLLFSI